MVVAGWGAVKFRGPTSERLMEGIIKVVTNKECSDKFKAFRRGETLRHLVLTCHNGWKRNIKQTILMTWKTFFCS